MATARRLTWLGQAGFRLELEGVCVVVDPWTSPHELRAVPPPPLELAADGVDWLLVTHEHLDHLDLGLLPRGDAALARGSGRRPRAGRAARRGPSCRAIGSSRCGPETGSISTGSPPASFPRSTASRWRTRTATGRCSARARGSSATRSARAARVYHPGDTIVTDALLDAVGPLGVDVALLPINGRDEEREARGIVGNMDAVEAVELALTMGASVLVPHHWDGFEGNTVPPGSAVDAADGRVHVAVPARWLPLDLA